MMSLSSILMVAFLIIGHQSPVQTLSTCSGSGGAVIANQCLTFSQTWITWDEAKKACSANSGQLASLADPQAVFNYVNKTYGNVVFWVGGSDNRYEGKWEWLNGRIIQGLPWGEGQPLGREHENCLGLDGDYGYDDWGCSYELRYICEIEQQSTYVCEHSELNIECGEGHVISVNHALYGRSSLDICTNGPGITESSLNCRSESSRQVLNDRCNGKKSCKVHASNVIFGDPCGGTFKYLEVEYACEIQVSGSCTNAGGRNIGGQCLFISSKDDVMNWGEALAACEGKGQQLAIPTDFRALKAFHTSNYGFYEAFWLGGSDIANEGTWLWIDGKPFDSFPWEFQQPDNDHNYGDSFGNGQDCLAVGWQHTYDDKACTEENRYICQLKDLPPTPDYYTSTTELSIADITGCAGGVEIAGQCLIFSSDNLSWSDAKKRCSMQNGRLAILNDPHAFKTYVTSNYHNDEKFWIGASDIKDEGRWVWLNDQLLGNQFPWHYGEPNAAFVNEDCLVLWGAALSDAPCDRLYQYVCEKVSNEPLPSTVNKKGQCPPRRSCPTDRVIDRPIQCSSDQDCAGFEKCCLDSCLEYKICKTSIGTDQTLVPNVVTGTRPYCDNCGISDISVNRGGGHTRILGGEPANKGEYPWQVFLGIDEWPGRCGGSIIKKNWILSAAHCFIDKDNQNRPISKLVIRVGAHELTDISDPNTIVIQFTQQDIANQVKLHNEYDGNKNFHDIALIELKEELVFTPQIQPVCLANVDDFAAHKEVIAAGWGKKHWAGNRVSQILQEVGLDTIGLKKCQELYRDNLPLSSSRKFDFNITKNMICTLTAGKDACQGDSGGALVMELASGIWVQVGITSFGYGCAYPNAPGVWTNVAKYKEWIDKTTRYTQC